MKTLLNLLKRNDLISICGMTTELGWKTKRTNLKGLTNCEDWLRNNPSNSIDLIFENETINIK